MITCAAAAALQVKAWRRHLHKFDNIDGVQQTEAAAAAAGAGDDAAGAADMQVCCGQSGSPPSEQAPYVHAPSTVALGQHLIQQRMHAGLLHEGCSMLSAVIQILPECSMVSACVAACLV
jgi:hypothetical protein